VRQIKRGEGWRLGWDPEADCFCGLVGGKNWAIELTEPELEDFCRLVVQLAETMAEMRQELMDAERIRCEVESDRIWLEVEGYSQAYELRMILLTGRRGEGTWDAVAVPELVQAIQTFRVF
jgi:hypothetical protein